MYIILGAAAFIGEYPIFAGPMHYWLVTVS